MKKKNRIVPLLRWGALTFCLVFLGAYVAKGLAQGDGRTGGGDPAPGRQRGGRDQGQLNATPDKTKRCFGGVRVPAGVYSVGSLQGQIDERPVRQVKLEAFVLDRCEVTWNRYMKCVAEGVCRRPPGEGEESKQGRRPVTRVTFRDAATFCRWEKKVLPTEDQWEAAARGKEARRYPWGEEASCEKANYGAFDGQGPCAEVNPGRPRKVGTGRADESPFGALDMAGNVWEWTRCSRQKSCGKGEAVLKGGSCCSMFLLPRSANRWPITGAYRDADIGFRCLQKVESDNTR